MTDTWSDAVDRDDEMDDESYHAREVYAFFGSAVYHAQVLEHGVINLLSVTNVMAQANSQDEYDELVAKNFRKTLGFLAKKLSNVLATDPQLLDDLAIAVEKRNFLAHSYWRERVDLMITPRGRNRLLVELQDIQKMFIEVDGRLEMILYAYSHTTREQVEEFAAKEWGQFLGANGYLLSELPKLGSP